MAFINDIRSVEDLVHLFQGRDALAIGEQLKGVGSEISNIGGAALDSFAIDPGQIEKGYNYLQKIGTRRSGNFSPACANPLFFVLGALLVHGAAGLGLYHITPKPETPERERISRERERLISEARTALRNESPDNRAGVKGDFILDSEAISKAIPERDAKALKERWQSKISEYALNSKSTAGAHRKLHQLISALYWDYWYFYKRANPNMGDFLSERKGNCVAQTKLIIAAFSELGIELPKNQGIGIQLFGDHLQPVLYSRNASGIVDTVTNLINGQRSERVVAPIYRPSIIYLGFLKKQGAYSSVTFDDLLIAQPWPSDMARAKQRQPGYDRNELDIELPETEAMSGMNAPEEGTMMPPLFKEPAKEADSAAGAAPPASGASDAGPADGGISDASSKSGDAGDTAVHAALFSEIPKEEIPADLDFRIGREPYIAFRSEELRQQYDRMKTDADAAQFLGKLTNIALIRIRKSSKIRRFFADPYGGIGRMSAADIRATNGKLARYYNAFIQGADGYSAFLDSSLPGSAQLDDAARERLLKESRLREFSEFYAMNELRRSFMSSIAQEPRRFILTINSIKDNDKRLAVMEFFETAYAPSAAYQKINIRSLVNGLRDPSQVAIASKRSHETQDVPEPMRLVWIDTEFPTPVQAPDISELMSAGGVTSPGDFSIAETKISSETMVNFVLAVKDLDLSRRWDRHLSNAFRRMNVNRALDHSFKRCCWLMIYDEKIKEVDAQKVIDDEAENKKLMDEVDREMEMTARNPRQSKILPPAMAELLSGMRIMPEEFQLTYSIEYSPPEEINEEVH